MGCCSEGIENDEGICKFLKINDDNTTSCELVIKNNYKNISIGKGCVLQNDERIYKYYLTNAKQYIDYIKNTSSAIHI